MRVLVEESMAAAERLPWSRMEAVVVTAMAAMAAAAKEEVA